MAEEVPRRIAHYEVRRLLRRGAMGVVYLARDTVRGQDVALKVMSRDIVSDPGARSRFADEASLLGRVDHRNLVKVFESGENAGVPFMAMEYLRGSSLADRLASSASLPVDTALDIMSQVCDGLQCLHGEGIVHGGIKPGNIWLLEDGGVKLLDFAVGSQTNVRLTQYGNVVGNNAYAAPEQLAGGTVDARTDIFSAGVVLFELLTRQNPFRAASSTAMRMKILHEPPPDIRALVPELPNEVVRAVEMALRKDPAQRYSRVTDFGLVLRLARALRAEPEPLEATPARSRRSPAPPETDLPLDERMLSRGAPGPTRREVEHDLVFRQPSEVKAATAFRPPPPGRSKPLVWTAAILVLLALAAVGTVVWRFVLYPQFQLDVRSIPAGAAIAIDGTATGRKTPAVVGLASRPNRVGLTLAGYEPVNATLSGSLRSGRSVEYRLRRLVQVHSEPAGARILLDGRDSGFVTPAAVPMSNPSPRQIELQLDGHESMRQQVTSTLLEGGALTVILAPVLANVTEAADKPAAPASPLVTVNLVGSYRFLVSGCGVTSPAAAKHTLQVMAPCTLRLRAPEYFLDVMRNVTAGPGEEVNLTAPPLVSVQLRSRHENCQLLVGGRDVGSPPADIRIAAGKYSATLQCPDGGTLQTTTFDIDAKQTVRRIDDFLR
jgi:serine/threonine protein kinase